MTAIECEKKIITYLYENDKDSFTYDDFSKMFELSNHDEGIVACFAALTNLCNLGVMYLSPVASIEDRKSLRWILREKFGEKEQTIKLSGNLCQAIASVVAGFSELTENPELMPNPIELQERDFSVLLNIIHMYSNPEDENSEENDISSELDKQEKSSKK